MFQLFYLVFLAAFFHKRLRICLEESVPTIFSAVVSVIFSSFDMIKIKIKVKIKTKYVPLFSSVAFTWSLHSRRVQNELLTYACYLILPAARSRAVRWNILFPTNEFIAQT